MLSNAQDVKLNYSKGASLLYFDVDSKTEKLSNKFGLSLSKNSYEFQIGYSSFSFSYDGKFLEQQDLYKNYMTDINGAYLSYSHQLFNSKNLNFSLGLELAFSQYSIFTNLENNLGFLYADYNIDQWSEEGYFSENNFETDLSKLNTDQLDEYNLNYLSFGPSIECSYELIDNFEIFIKSIYRKNTIDLLDNVNVNNIRGVSSTNATDNQLDLMFGIKFLLNNKNSIDNDSLVSLIDSITQTDEINANSIEEENESKPNNIEEATEIQDNKAYILGFFDFDPDSVNVSTDITKEDIALMQSDGDDEVSDAYESEIVEIEQSQFYNNNNSDTLYYLIVGVFSSQFNLQTFAQSLKIDSSNQLSRNNLNYLYAIKSDNLNEVRQLRDSLGYESWILSLE